MPATYLIRHAESPQLSREIAENEAAAESGAELLRRGVQLLGRAAGGESESIGRLGGGVGKALANWGLETWLYAILMSAVYGTTVGWGMMYVARFALRKYVWWPRHESIQCLTRLGDGSTANPTFYCPLVLASSLSVPVVCLPPTISWPALLLAPGSTGMANI